MTQNVPKPKCLHFQKDVCELNPTTSYCYHCSSLLIKTETENIITTVKPNKFYTSQDTTPLFISLIDEHRAHIFRNKTDYIKVRAKIIKDMKIFCNFCNFSKKTFFLSLDYFDRICSSMISFNLNALKQISQFCILLSAKYQENGEKSFEVQKKIFEKISNNFQKDELYLLKLLDYDLNVFTAYDILIDIMNCGFLFEDENFSTKKVNIIYSKIENMLYLFSESKFYIDMTPKEIALSIIGFIRESLGLESFTEKRFKSIFFTNEATDEKFYMNCLIKFRKCFKVKNDDSKKKNINEPICIKKDISLSPLNSLKIYDSIPVENGIVHHPF